MSTCLNGTATHTTKLIESFAHNLNRLESAIYYNDGKIERTQENLAKIQLDYAEVKESYQSCLRQNQRLTASRTD